MKASEVRALLVRYDLRLYRERGQHFLLGASHADRLAELAGVEPDDTVIEVGTGLGALTRALAARAKRVVTLEIDAGLVRVLRQESLLGRNVELVHADALAVDLDAFFPEDRAPVRVVANLPYSAATPLLRRLLDLRTRLVDWSIMVQREVGRRVVAAPGSSDYGSLSVLHHLCVDADVVAQLGGERFYPPAGVRSSFLRLVPRKDAVGQEDLLCVERLARAAFNQRRKMLSNSLRSFGSEEKGSEVAHVLAAQGLSPRDRPSVVTPMQWLTLARALQG